MWRLCVLCVLLSVGQAAGKGGPATQTSANKHISDGHNQGKESATEAKPSANNMDSGGRDVNQTGTRNTSSLCPTGPTGLTHTDVYARLGSDVLLPVTYNLTRDKDPQKCDEFTWSLSQKGSGNDSRIAKSKRCRMPELNFQRFPNYNVSLDGHLTVSNVTRNHSGNYIFTVYTSIGPPRFNHCYILHVEAPVSQPILNVSCLPDGGAAIVCGINSGDDPQFSILVNGISLLKNSSRPAEKATEVHVSTTSPGPWNITCFARNRVSDHETGKSQVKCTVPVSEPVLVVRCLPNGSLEISCSVVNGSDLIFSLSENGKYLLVNYTNEEKSVNVTTSSPGPWDVHCSVGNHLMWKKTNVTSSACPGSSRASCMSCLQKSVIGGVVALIVTTAPLFLASFYIGRNARPDQ